MAGGLETCRLLAASSKVAPEGLAIGSGTLGRFWLYMCHVEGTLGILNLPPATCPAAWNFERTRDGVYARRQMRLFPTCGHANPIFTILALTLRLSDHLKPLFGQKTSNRSSAISAQSEPDFGH